MTESLIVILAAFHTLGAFIGTAMTTMAEIAYTRAADDGMIDHHERKYLRRLFHGINIGMTLVVLAGIALIVTEYLLPDSPQAAFAAPFWVAQILTLVVLLTGWELSKRQVVWWFGSAVVLTGWWTILFIDLGLFNTASFLSLILTYVVSTFVVVGLLTYLRMLVHHKRSS